ncbi:23S rRNA (uracil(1939)-C(5))-methyltransferase RlmD [Aminipila butyrica]|uniref:23S rRNA (Uracil(1939)-C(5))-methyltransferase RlmD n=1 Tax=Aminipila butyrica TaxID=433296 RepID=A0A858BV69_9FIRM|nr:23S rRNA (uracil(1939)-C(5))-methyltransferase RlmD [Aminipila butyrica]QIB69292.1 23S rRNA (uracil(1939)-C(5))-methyltransferase RlmD [Aminipila butyrica]
MEVCKHDEFCGGCIHQGIPYDKQVEMKGREVLRLLEAKGIPADRFLGIEGSPKQYAYRNKMEYTFGDQVKDGEMTLGMHQKGRFMSIVTVDECQLVDPDFNILLKAVLEFCGKQGYGFYHKKTHQGLVRNLIVRKGERTGQLLVNLVTSSQLFFDETAFVECLQSLELNNPLVGILRTINDGLADAVNCDELKVLWGQDYYMEKILGLDFKVSAFSFFQTNIEAVERLYVSALGLIDQLEGKTVYDLFCGTGTITQALALKAKKAIGVELVAEAVEAAKVNAQLNGLTNCEFLAGDVFDVLDHIEEKPDVIVVDPPRVGIQNKALSKIVNYGVKQIVYISCNPKTLAENLQFMELYGYEVKSVKAYDNFPMTKHVECVCLLEKR